MRNSLLFTSERWSGSSVTALFWVVLLSSSMALSGCNGKEHSNSSASSGNDGIFRLNLTAQINSLDPAFADNQANTWAAVQLFNGLLKLGPDMDIQGDLARIWQSSTDGLKHTFFLRTDAWFHPDPCFPDSSRRMVADDVVYSFKRLMDPTLGADGFWVFNGVIDPEKGFEVINDSTLLITLIQPFEPFLSRLTMPYCSILPKEAVEHYGADFRNHPVGTGPFKLGQWKEGEKLYLARNERYFGRDEQGKSLPYLKGVQFSFLSAKGTEFLKFRNGELDFVSDLDAEFLDQVLTGDGLLKPEFAGEMILQRGPYLNTEYLGINLDAVKGSALGLEYLRQALSFGIDKKRMISYQRNGKGMAAECGMVPPSLLGMTGASCSYGYRYDPEKASILLAKSGYPGGQGLPDIILRTNDQYLDICLFLQAQWKELGIPVKVENMDGKILRESMVKGQSGFFRASWIADYPDAESFLALFYGIYDAPPNYTRTKNPEFDDLYKRAVSESNTEFRKKIYRSMDSLIMESAAVIPLYYDEVLLLTRTNIKGLELNAMNLLKLESVRKEP